MQVAAIWMTEAPMMMLPARMIFFRSISSPIMKSMRIRPSSEITWIDSSDRTKCSPEGPSRKPPAMIGEDGGLAEELGANAENPRGNDGKGDVLNQPVHARPKRLTR